MLENQDGERPRVVPDLPHPAPPAELARQPPECRDLPHVRRVRRAASGVEAVGGPGAVPLPVGLHGQGGGHGARHHGAAGDVLDVLRRGVHDAAPDQVRGPAEEEAAGAQHARVPDQHGLDGRRVRRGQAHEAAVHAQVRGRGAGRQHQRGDVREGPAVRLRDPDGGGGRAVGDPEPEGLVDGQGGVRRDGAEAGQVVQGELQAVHPAGQRPVGVRPERPQPFTSAACTRSQEESDKVEYTRFGNPRMPAVAVVCEWVRKAWRDTDSNTVINSVSAAGFADSYLDWHVAKHDVYGEQFCTSWEAADEDHEDMDDFNLDELHDALDDAALIDE
ncbi:hypothetical protein ON010_g17592 [Phytophthora cinnamomi]|nr:hypothetical protein ON010_g17592 [Phytophthora cinnamomi]